MFHRLLRGAERFQRAVGKKRIRSEGAACRREPFEARLQIIARLRGGGDPKRHEGNDTARKGSPPDGYNLHPQTAAVIKMSIACKHCVSLRRRGHLRRRGQTCAEGVRRKILNEAASIGVILNSGRAVERGGVTPFTYNIHCRYGYSQSSTVSPATRRNSRVLFDTRASPTASACPAMSTSNGPIALPVRSIACRTFAACFASSSPNGNRQR